MCVLLRAIVAAEFPPGRMRLCRKVLHYITRTCIIGRPLVFTGTDSPPFAPLLPPDAEQSRKLCGTLAVWLPSGGVRAQPHAWGPLHLTITHTTYRGGRWVSLSERPRPVNPTIQPASRVGPPWRSRSPGLEIRSQKTSPHHGHTSI